MKIHSNDFRVREGDDVDLTKWPTKVAPVYKSKDRYKEILEEHVAKLSAQQQLLYADNRGFKRTLRQRNPADTGSFSSCFQRGANSAIN